MTRTDAMPPRSERSSDPRALHLRLTHLNRLRMRPTHERQDWRSGLRNEHFLKLEEGEFLERELLAVNDRAAEAPTDCDGFLRWFESLQTTGPGQGDPLFDYLAERATQAELRWFVAQEIGGEAGFDDLVALTQVGFAAQPKLEMARNYWDEMGRGHAKGMHGPMLAEAARELAVDYQPEITVWESLALANLMAGLASNRYYAYHSVGALGAIELTAPGRVARVDRGLTRVGVSSRGRRYFQLHAILDVKHWREWNREVLRPLLEADPRCARALAEGALMRLAAGARCFRRYRAELQLNEAAA